MKLTLQIQLLPDQEQAAKLKSSIERFCEHPANLSRAAERGSNYWFPATESP
jgi:hypothetical protein